MDALKLILVSLAGWMNHQQHVIEYLQEDVRGLKGPQGGRSADEQRGRLARKAKLIRYGRLGEIANVVTPQTLLAWHSKLVAKKSDSSLVRRKVGRPPAAEALRNLEIKMAKENPRWGRVGYANSQDITCEGSLSLRCRVPKIEVSTRQQVFHP